MNRKHILLIFGGESSEHDVSIMSARNVYAAMDNEKYHIELCYIDTHGKWWLLEGWIDNPKNHGGVQLAAVPGAGSFITIPGNRILHIDVVFPILHGKNGEDGTIQGLLEMTNIVYVGCGVESSAICMDKDSTKRLLRANGIPVVDWYSVLASEDVDKLLSDKQAIEKNIGKGPWFVKPSRAGSSVGVTKVRQYDKLLEAITLAHKHDNLALIEPAITGRELEVAVLGNEPNIQVSGVGEVILGAEFYDYNDKYSPDSTSSINLNPDLSENVRLQIQQIAQAAYLCVGARGLARVDFFLGEDEKMYVGEINTMPGFTNISMYPKLWHDKGFKYPKLVDRLIELAIE